VVKEMKNGARKGGVIPYIKELARKLRKESTDTEAILWHSIRNRKLGKLKFRRQFPIGRYIADFYCDEVGLVIEIDGNVHRKPDQETYDTYRREVLETQGLKVLRFTNEEVLTNRGKVLKVIWNETMKIKKG
jgi:adenine-specific DNA-methyltransferase